MAQLIFALKDVPESEANAIRSILDDNGIIYYETAAGRWNISVAALWVADNEDYVPARQLINAYQIELQQELAKEQDEMPLPTLWQTFSHRPFTVIVFLTAVAIVLGLSIVPFLRFG